MEILCKLNNSWDLGPPAENNVRADPKNFIDRAPPATLQTNTVNPTSPQALEDNICSHPTPPETLQAESVAPTSPKELHTTILLDPALPGDIQTACNYLAIAGVVKARRSVKIGSRRA